MVLYLVASMATPATRRGRPSGPGVRAMLAVIYRWKLHAGKEKAFIQAWSRMTALVRRHHGSRGSRLHRAGDETYLAYAQWPDRQTFMAFLAHAPTPAEARLLQSMQDCTQQSFERMEMDIVAGRLDAP